MYIYIYVCVCACVYIYIYIYIYTCVRKIEFTFVSVKNRKFYPMNVDHVPLAPLKLHFVECDILPIR